MVKLYLHNKIYHKTLDHSALSIMHSQLLSYWRFNKISFFIAVLSRFPKTWLIGGEMWAINYEQNVFFVTLKDFYWHDSIAFFFKVPYLNKKSFVLCCPYKISLASKNNLVNLSPPTFPLSFHQRIIIYSSESRLTIRSELVPMHYKSNKNKSLHDRYKITDFECIVNLYLRVTIK